MSWNKHSVGWITKPDWPDWGKRLVWFSYPWQGQENFLTKSLTETLTVWHILQQFCNRLYMDNTAACRLWYVSNSNEFGKMEYHCLDSPKCVLCHSPQPTSNRVLTPIALDQEIHMAPWLCSSDLWAWRGAWFLERTTILQALCWSSWLSCKCKSVPPDLSSSLLGSWCHHIVWSVGGHQYQVPSVSG